MRWYSPAVGALIQALNEYHSGHGSWPRNGADLEHAGVRSIRFSYRMHGMVVYDSIPVDQASLKLVGTDLKERSSGYDITVTKYSYVLRGVRDELWVGVKGYPKWLQDPAAGRGG